ncbi:hypothetical protein ACS0ZG_36295 [Burkholderia gladioli]|uniref:hypothetical protein n=1 Tax=Burkholderia gladioli TaxID=28095 RepID=UPI0006494524|nr:hypothetical protein [Burkholderia gladioli]MBU9169781.1 hypothetical protein [Burkholderia gladioli]MBU9378853.1 hypothetical protein [Burkholderia gladioli]MDA0573909.1 hypothetical protein [Burkholderia gladioli]MDA0602248.1 hypothetical protein [Burkholderia gladioli]NRF89378.1 hypothetical protein [Burkholderia gladioli]
MKLNRIADDAEIEVSHEELLVLNAALNEVCNGIDMFEFETRIGAPREKVERLMAEIQAALDQFEKR